MNKLSIFWNDKESPHFRWYLDTHDSYSVADQGISLLDSHEILKADLSALTEIAKNKKVELILSSQDIHLNQVELPNKAQRHLTKAIPYLIEEALAEPVDNLFIAIGNKNKHQKIPVRGISRAYLLHLLELFKRAEITLNAIYVDIDLLESEEVGYTALIHQNNLLVNQTSDDIWRCELSDFSWLVQKQLAELDDELPIAIPLKIIAEDLQQSTLLENQLPAGRFAPQVLTIDSVDEYLSASKEETINLLQGEFAVQTENSQLKALLTKAASVLAVVLFVHLFYQGSQWFTLNTEYQQLQQEKASLWKKAFPGKKYRDKQADRQLKKFLSDLEGGKGESAFLPILTAVTEQIDDLQQLYPTNMNYDALRSELRLDLVAKQLDLLEIYKSKLRQQGYQVEGTSATQRGDGYSSRLIVKKDL